MNKIVILKSIWEKVKIYLQNDRYGNFVFFFCRLNKNNKGLDFLVNDFSRVKDEDVEISSDYFTQINLNALLEVVNRANKEGMALVEAHNHPFSEDHVSFSYADLEGFSEFVPYILDSLKKPYGATVWSKKSFDGRVWKKSYSNDEIIHEIRIIGKNITKYAAASIKLPKKKPKLTDRDNRQILALGKSGQVQISDTSVAIIGLGGIGSHVTQQLAYLGVRDFVLVDYDCMQIENLNRIVGAFPSDIGKPKVEIAAKIIKSIAGHEKVRIVHLQKELRREDVLDHIKSCDVIFGCIDNDGARLILNELAISYMIPYIDSAFGIHAEKCVIREAGGRVVLVIPDGPCLLCCKDIDISEASYFLSPREEQIFNEKRGYVSGVNIPSPSIISLDGIVASIAVTEFISLITGIREAIQYSSYDFLTQKLNRRIIKKNKKCVQCDLSGLGDDSEIMRYAIKN